MRIGLIDVDGHNFPNLALMKISAYHKSKGDSVEWYQPMFSGHMDKVYMSKVFSFTPDYEYYIDADDVTRGGQDIALVYKTAKRFMTNRKIMFYRKKSSINIQITPYTESLIRLMDI